jgi:SAM-dependent methyltransferase
MVMTAAEKWASDLASWAIPEQILSQAPESPWIHPVQQFVVEDDAPDTPSHARAREALPMAGTVLDVGCGGGRAAFALAPPAARVIGVDQQEGMVEAFAVAAQARGLDHHEVLGDWPEASGRVPMADVVVCHHVAYNVGDLVPFVEALSEHATRRVVIELPVRHPLSNLSPLWKRFWDLDRPISPTAADALAVCRDAGFDAHLETWAEDVPQTASVSQSDHVRFTRVRLCLPAERDAEVSQALDEMGPMPSRRLATLWWDV